MVLVVFTFVLFLVHYSRTVVPPINEDDPEKYVEWTTPKETQFWWRYSSGAEFVGNLFAGQYQFPWVVDIRSIDIDMEEWSVGNLLTVVHVLTSNRGIVYIIEAEKKQVEAEYEQEGLVATYEYTHININYCSTYLWEEYKFSEKRSWLEDAEKDLFTNDAKETGTRYARSVYRHPLFEDNGLSYDVGIIKLNNPIRPLPPFTDHMPFWFDFLHRKVSEVDLSHMEGQRRICYVASYGKHWRNLWDSYVLDYKVKYRVYWTQMTQCTSRLHLYRRGFPKEPLVYNRDGKGTDDKNLMCFQTRARVGAVCDHDRGAPLVCNGLVYGFVARGANYTQCNNLLPLPFLVQKSTVLNSYFASIISHVFIPNYTPGKPAGQSKASSKGPTGIYFQAIPLLVIAMAKPAT